MIKNFINRLVEWSKACSSRTSKGGAKRHYFKPGKFLTVMILILLLVLPAAAYFNQANSLKLPSILFLTQSDGSKNANLPLLAGSKILQLDEPVNILVAGIDKYVSPKSPPSPGPWRSDVLVVVRIDPQAQQVKCLSIPRDTRVDIPGHGKDKITHAYAYGEMPLAVATVEGFTGVRLDHTVVVDYSIFSHLVDILGGIDIDVKEEMKDKDYHFYPGRQHMDGQQAYYFVTDRNTPMADIARIDSQHQFLYALLEKVREQAGSLDLARMYLEFQKSTDTSFSMSEVIKLVFFAQQLNKDKITMQTLPGKPQYIKGISYWIPDQDSLQQLREEMFKVERATP